MGRDRLGNFVNGDTVHGHTNEPFHDFELSGVVEGRGGPRLLNYTSKSKKTW